MKTRKTHRPEISLCPKTGQWLADNQPITFEQAREHWLALDADWTQGAFREMASEA